MIITSFITVTASTKSIKTSIIATIILNVANTIIYFIHEIIWGKYNIRINMKTIKVSSLDHLKKLCTKKPDEVIDIILHLNGGLRSSKTIAYYDNKWDVFNLIDSSSQEELTDEQLSTETNIVEGIEKGALYAEIDNV
jgi:uncharacterized membrane protein